jgi:hypothetical protein
MGDRFLRGGELFLQPLDLLCACLELGLRRMQRHFQVLPLGALLGPLGFRFSSLTLESLALFPCVFRIGRFPTFGVR